MSRLEWGNTKGFKKPLDIATGFIFLRYGELFGAGALEDFWKNFKSYEMISEDYLGKAGRAIACKDDSSMIDYAKDHAEIFYNNGKLILLDLANAWFYKKFEDAHPQAGSCMYDDESHGILMGLRSNYVDFSHSQLRKLIRDFAPDRIDDTISPVLHTNQYFDDGILGMGKASVLPVLATALYYTMLGFIMSNMTNIELKEFFKFGEEVTKVNGQEVVKNITISYEKTETFYKFASMYSAIISHVEVIIGKTFNDRFHLYFKAIGEIYNDTFDTRFELEEEARYDEIIGGNFDLTDTTILLVRELVTTTSIVYVGDDCLDIRKMYIKQIYNDSTPYVSVYDKLTFVGTERSENIKNYTAVIDVAAYEELVKVAIATKMQLEKSSGAKYISNFYELMYLERLISDAYTYWDSKKTPLKINGVEPMYVEVEKFRGETRKELREPNTIKYSVAYARAMELIREINARYCEAYEFMFSKKWARGMNGDFTPTASFYKKTESIKPEDYSFDYQDDAVRAYTEGRLPYLVTIGKIGDRELNAYINQNISEIDFAKLHKLDALDREYIDVTRSASKTPYEIVKSATFNDAVIDNDSELATKLADILQNCNGREICYLSRK